jgi:hypothetical protein
MTEMSAQSRATLVLAGRFHLGSSGEMAEGMIGKSVVNCFPIQKMKEIQQLLWIQNNGKRRSLLKKSKAQL